MTKWAWIFLILLSCWIGIMAGQHITLYRFNSEIERLSNDNEYLNNRIRNLRATVGKQEAELTILKRKIGRR